MSANYKQLTNFLVELGIEKVPHTEKTYLGHLVNVYRLMEAEGCTEELCRAGMFHSIYGTQQFQGFKLELDQRPMVARLIGERAEKLAYLNCAMQRETFDEAALGDGGVYRFTDRITREPVVLDRADFDDLCRVHLYDWLEQVRVQSTAGAIGGPPIDAWRNERGATREFTAYERTFAAEPM